MLYKVPLKDEEYCIHCRRPALMGYHPICLIQAAKHTVSVETMKTVCPTCPFRKNPTWMQKAWYVLNRLKLKYGTLQDCHQNYFTSRKRVCKGMVTCFKGGSDEIISPSEFFELEPVATYKESQDIFNGIKESSKDTL